MAAFGISFPKLTLCRSTTSKTDTNAIPITTTTTAATTATNTPTTGISTINTRTLSLSIKNVPSQPLHYDVSTITTTTATATATTPKKKSPSVSTTILAIDGETKQLPKNLSVFNELQLDEKVGDIHQKIRPEETSNGIIISSSLSPMGPIDYRSDVRFLNNNASKNEENKSVKEQRSNHTFTPPTSSLSPNSSSNDLHFISSSISVDLPELKYAIEKFLTDEDDPVYQIAEEFSTGCSLFQSDVNSNVRKSDLTYQQYDINDNKDLHLMSEKKNINDDVSLRSSQTSNNVKWYVSELRINRPFIYRTQWPYGQQCNNYRKFSHSVNDLKQIYKVFNRQEQNNKNKLTIRKTDDIAYSTLSLQNFNNQKEQYNHHQSDDNLLLNKQLSSTDDDLNNVQMKEENQHISSQDIQRPINRSTGKDNRLIRNESVKKKLFDILNDDELENACLEDMSQEYEQISFNQNHHELQTFTSFSTSSSDDALYSSPPNELQVPLLPPPLPPHSSSYNENLWANIHNTTEYYFGRSRLITTSLDKIPMNNNSYEHSSSQCNLRPSYEHMRPSWYTSPSPRWRTDDQSPLVSILKRHSSKDDHHHHLNNIDPNRLISKKMTEYDVKEHKYLQKYNHHHQNDQKDVSYALMNNTSTPLVYNSTTMLPIIQDKSSNLLMFI